jgi:diketogulonate reductase-like aldo/keto reductase
MPYHPLDPLEMQIHTSIASSLKNLRPDEDSDEDSYLDCLLLHSPLPTPEQTLQAWSIMESYVPHKIKSLGISNVTLPLLQAIYENAKVKPSVVQNRFYPQTRYDVPLRAFCERNNITYQSFWTLTGNPKLLKLGAVQDVARAVAVSTSVVLYALVIDLGIAVLNGTTSKQHMEEDLEGIRQVREWAKENGVEWNRARLAFLRAVEPAA